MNNVIDIQQYRKPEVSSFRSTLSVNSKTGKVTSSNGHLPDFGSRLQQIRASLDRINRLMEELKTYSKPR